MCNQYQDIYGCVDLVKTNPNIINLRGTTFNDELISAALEQTSGEMLNSDMKLVIAYRPYSAIAALLGDIPDLWLIKRHDSTEVNTPSELINLLKSRQQDIDNQCGIAQASAENAIATSVPRTFSYLPRIVG